jgi:hypothetical protein
LAQPKVRLTVPAESLFSWRADEIGVEWPGHQREDAGRDGAGDGLKSGIEIAAVLRGIVAGLDRAGHAARIGQAVQVRQRHRGADADHEGLETWMASSPLR